MSQIHSEWQEQRSESGCLSPEPSSVHLGIAVSQIPVLIIWDLNIEKDLETKVTNFTSAGGLTCVVVENPPSEIVFLSRCLNQLL